MGRRGVTAGERIVAAVARLEDDLVAAVSEAVRMPSVNPSYPGQDYDEVVGGEGRVAHFVAELYARAGCEVDVFAMQPGRENAVGRLPGSGGGRSLIFNGHIDVVPPGPHEDWTGGDPWSGRVEGGAIWGRGACDMKGGVIAQALAARALHDAGVSLRGDLVLEAVVGEEMMEHELGTSACVERGYSADAAVVSEPSGPPESLAIVPVTSGVLSFRVSVEGKATHACMRGETIRPGGYGEAVGVSAIDKLMLVYEALLALEDEWGRTKQHPLFRPGHFAIYPGVFVGGPSSGLVPFFIADAARLDYVVIYHPDEPVEAVRREIESCVGAAAEADAWLRSHPPQIEWRSHWPPGAVSTDHPIVSATRRAHEAASGSASSLHGFAAVDDTTFLCQAGVPAISYGPGDLRIAHAVDEHVVIDELVTATRTYALLALEWCG